MTERTDRELTELAAKAAGIDHPGGEHSRYNDGRLWDCNGLRWWNPLENDGDTFRLMVALGIDTFSYSGCAVARNPVGFVAEEPCAPETLPGAMRRAIVRAAAAMAEGGEHG